MRQIITLGGGGFSMEPENLALDRYILSQCATNRPNVCFVPTASGDSERYVANFQRAFNTLSCVPTTLNLFPMPPTRDLEGFVRSQDVIYVGGGSTRNLIALWKEWHLDEIIKKAYQSGVILAGISAGMNCWFEQYLTDSISPDLDPMSGLGLLGGSACPHYRGETMRKPRFRELIESGDLKAGVAADDSCGIHWIDEQISAVVASKLDAQAYACGMNQGAFVESVLPARLLDPENRTV